MKNTKLMVLALAAMFAFSAQATVLTGVGATKIATQPASLTEQGEYQSQVRVLYDTYELVADTTGGTDTINMGGLLPKGARVINVTVVFDVLDTSGGTLDIGWRVSAELSAGSAIEALDADGFMANVGVTSAGSQSMQGDQATRPGNLKKFDAAVQPFVSFDGDCDATSGGVSLYIEYVVE